MEKDKNKLKIKVFTAFSGYDSQCMALDCLKEDYDWFDYELVGWSEIDEPAIRSHNAVYPQYADKNYGDISKIDWDKVPDFDLFTYSSPCFVAGTKVIVKDSEYGDTKIVNIECVEVGQLALTHTGEYKKVLEVMKNPYKGVLYTITDCYGSEVTCTPDHKFYCGNIENDNCEWVAAKDIDVKYHKAFLAEYNKYAQEYDNYDIVKSYRGFTSILIENDMYNDIYVYNLEVEDNHSYTANDFVVHNCQSFSICGKQHGGEEGSGTRSSLLWECRRAIMTKRPKFCILENVKALVSNKFFNLFERWMDTVNSFGYNSRWMVLNAADYDVPQGRERVFLVSVRKETEDDDIDYYFPAPLERKRRIEDFFDQEVPEDSYLDDRDVPKFMDLLNHTGESFSKLTETHKDIAEQRDIIIAETEEMNKQKEVKLPDNALFFE